MPNRYHRSDIPQIANKNVFVDTNVLIYWFWPTAEMNSHSPTNLYSGVLSSLLRNGFKLFLNSIVVSEAVNRILRIEFEKYKENGGVETSFKGYRDSEEGKQAQSDVYSIFNNQIFNLFSLKEPSLTKDDVKSFLTVDSLDFNDKVVANVCVSNDLILLTHDKDFVNSNVNILSENRAYFV